MHVLPVIDRCWQTTNCGVCENTTSKRGMCAIWVTFTWPACEIHLKNELVFKVLNVSKNHVCQTWLFLGMAYRETIYYLKTQNLNKLGPQSQIGRIFKDAPNDISTICLFLYIITISSWIIWRRLAPMGSWPVRYWLKKGYWISVGNNR